MFNNLTNVNAKTQKINTQTVHKFSKTMVQQVI